MYNKQGDVFAHFVQIAFVGIVKSYIQWNLF